VHGERRHFSLPIALRNSLIEFLCTYSLLIDMETDVSQAAWVNSRSATNQKIIDSLSDDNDRLMILM